MKWEMIKRRRGKAVTRRTKMWDLSRQASQFKNQKGCWIGDVLWIFKGMQVYTIIYHTGVNMGISSSNVLNSGFKWTIVYLGYLQCVFTWKLNASTFTKCNVRFLVVQWYCRLNFQCVPPLRCCVLVVLQYNGTEHYCSTWCVQYVVLRTLQLE